MRNKLVIGGLTLVVGFLLATNSVVADAAGFITSAQIKNGTIKSVDVKNDSLKGKDIREGTLTGVNASTLGGLAPSAYAGAAQPAYTSVTLGAGYTQFAGYTTPGFLKDTLGFVHLKGTMNCPGGGTAFTLPVGARPLVNMVFPLAVGSSGAGNVQILTTGAVVTFHADGLPHACSVDGITFRTDNAARPGDAQRPAGNPNN